MKGICVNCGKTKDGKDVKDTNDFECWDCVELEIEWSQTE